MTASCWPVAVWSLDWNWVPGIRVSRLVMLVVVVLAVVRRRECNECLEEDEKRVKPQSRHDLSGIVRTLLLPLLFSFECASLLCLGGGGPPGGRYPAGSATSPTMLMIHAPS